MKVSDIKLALEGLSFPDVIVIGCETIPNPKETCESLITLLLANPGSKRHMTYYDKLMKIISYGEYS